MVIQRWSSMLSWSLSWGRSSAAQRRLAPSCVDPQPTRPATIGSDIESVCVSASRVTFTYVRIGKIGPRGQDPRCAVFGLFIYECIRLYMKYFHITSLRFDSSVVERGIADPKVTGSTPVRSLFFSEPHQHLTCGSKPL
jgi:hypothetical protein